MINYKKIFLGVIAILPTLSAISVYAGDISAHKLTFDEQKTAHLCLQYLEKYPVKQMPQSAAPALKWCNRNIGTTCSLAKGKMTAQTCESDLIAWFTGYVPSPPPVEAVAETMPTTTMSSTPPVTQTTKTAPSVPQTTIAPVKSAPVTSTTTDQTQKTKEKKSPGINWF